MNYDDVIRDFAARTRQNLEYIEREATGKPEPEVFEVTQLVNSMLGLLVFPQQRYFDRIPETPLEELERQGWPRIQVSESIQRSPDFRPCRNLRDLVRTLRNAISHFNLEFRGDEENKITILRIWNVDTRNPRHPKTWEAQLTLEDLKSITYHFIELLET